MEPNTTTARSAESNAAPVLTPVRHVFLGREDEDPTFGPFDILYYVVLPSPLPSGRKMIQTKQKTRIAFN